MQTILRFLFLLICLSLASCEPKISEKKDKAMNERKLSEIISLEHNKLIEETTQKINLLEKNTKKYLETLSDEDYSKWRKAWRSAHQSFIAITFLPINENDLSKASSAMSNGSPGPQNFNQVMSNVFALRIISQGASGNAICEDYIGDTLIDNIQLIPEPNTVGLTVLAGLILIMIKNQKSVLT